MSKILLVTDYYEGEFRSANLNAVTAAQQLAQKAGTTYDIAIVGGPADAVKSLGAAKALVLSGSGLEHYTAQAWANALIPVIQKAGYSHVMLPGTVLGKDLAPRLAAALDAGQATDITGIVDASTFTRPTYAGNISATVKVSSANVVLTVRGTAFPAAAKGGDSAVENVAASAGEVRMQYGKFEGAAGSGRPSLADASVVVSGGRGTKGDFAAVYTLADALKAGVGASRAVVDAGWAPNDWQIGQTGKVVAPKLYIALGISGAIQHWAGMKDSKTIVAVNKDPEAPIMELADLCLVGDLFQVAPEMASKLPK